MAGELYRETIEVHVWVYKDQEKSPWAWYVVDLRDAGYGESRDYKTMHIT